MFPLHTFIEKKKEKEAWIDQRMLQEWEQSTATPEKYGGKQFNEKKGKSVV